jgi:polyphosphate kinase
MSKKDKKKHHEEDVKHECKEKLGKKFYEKELSRLDVELVKIQEWVKYKKLKVVVIFEGRDAAGKSGVIKKITENLNPRFCRIAALGVPTDKEKNLGFSKICSKSSFSR